MDKTVFTQDEFLLKAGISREALTEWIKWKLVRPAGFTEEQVPLFSDETLARTAHIRKLVEFGYGLDEIQKILKKVGLPQKKAGRETAVAKGRFLTVGDLAERSGVSPRTIKHWEDKGIIEPDMRTGGGFRLYSGDYVHLCRLIRDLQLFGYTLEEIKGASSHFRDLMSVRAEMDALSKADVEAKLEAMLADIQALYEKMKLLKEGIARWDSLLKKEKKDILNLKAKNRKRIGTLQGQADA
jgi:DNA-binding transcriptional MerR regulator